MNVVFKVYWNNPIEMVAEAGTQQLTFEVPLGAIISNPSSGGGTASYPSFTGNAAKVLTVNATEDDVEWTTAVTQVYVDTQDSLLQDQINLKADATAVNQVLSTKADLVGGKVLASQSRPSTIVMDNSTYVITFTDATGAVQTIDLPIESLFKDANYNSTNKELILTLPNNSTKTIPLTDLVDLPEIVLATSNPAVAPTSGQKVYFNTSLGKVWFNVAGVWTYSGNLMTDAEKIKLANTSGTNTGDETTSSIQTKRPLKTIEGQSLEGSGNIDLTKNDIGLGNVDNTSDLDKPISTATQNALNLKENVANKATDLSSPDNTKYPTTLAVVKATKKATITVELISQLTTNFYAPNALRINSTALISGSGTLTLKVNDVAYTLTNLIPQGAKITAETTSQSVYNLISIYE